MEQISVDYERLQRCILQAIRAPTINNTKLKFKKEKKKLNFHESLITIALSRILEKEHEGKYKQL